MTKPRFCDIFNANQKRTFNPNRRFSVQHPRAQRRRHAKYLYHRPLTLRRIARIGGALFVATGLAAIIAMLATTLSG